MFNLPSTPPERKVTYKYKSTAKYETPEVSIITPFYNVSDIFRETVSCILGQSFQNFEWIIVDDCSGNEESIAMLEEIKALDSRIKVIRADQNGGPGAARNIGIKQSTAPFLFFVDADDLLEYTVIEKYWLFLNFNKEFYFCNAWHYGFGAQSYLWQKGFETGKQMLRENVIQPTFMARRSLFDFVEYDASIRDGFEDWDFWMRCAVAGFWGYTIKEPLYWYRRVEDISAKWANWDMGKRMEQFGSMLIDKYGDRLENHFPTPHITSFPRGSQLATSLLDGNKINSIVKTGKRRIFFVIPWMSIGGADKFNLDLLEGFSKKGIEVTVITTQHAQNVWLNNFQKYTSDIFVLHNYSSESSYFDCLSYLIQSRQPDCILFSNSEIGYYLSPLIKYAFPNIPLMDYNHMEEDYWNLGGHPQQSVLYRSIIDHHVVSSNHLKKWMVNRGVPAEKISVVYTGIDSEKVKPSLKIRAEVREHWKVDDNLCVITFTGRIASQKQPLVLVNTIKELSKTIPDGFVLAIIGDGPEKQALEKWVSANQLIGKIWFFGALSNEETINVLKASDIFFLPSLMEGISLAVYEAMAVGLPIVGADVGGQKELVSIREGILIQRNKPEREINDYAKVLATLITDKERRIKMAASARAKIENGFGLQDMWEKMEATLEKTIQEKSMVSKNEIISSFRQVYSLLFFERQLAENLWHSRGTHPAASEQFDYDLDKAKSIAENVEWYQDNYEILPGWYKKTGHLLKIMNGKKNWRSIYSNKYASDPRELSAIEWYIKEYDALPEWYKKFGAYLKNKKGS